MPPVVIAAAVVAAGTIAAAGISAANKPKPPKPPDPPPAPTAPVQQKALAPKAEVDPASDAAKQEAAKASLEQKYLNEQRSGRTSTVLTPLGNAASTTLPSANVGRTSLLG